MTQPEGAKTTHDWSAEVDLDHLTQIRLNPGLYAPGGLVHLLLEVIAYANDEAASLDRKGVCTITLHPDGSISVADDGRGTDTRPGTEGRPLKKPVMATRDLRFFDGGSTACLPDGLPRKGMSVVAALSQWLTHTNRRLNGAWTQRYEHGIPTTGLVAIEVDGTTGTTVRFLPGPDVRPLEPLTPACVSDAASRFSHLDVVIRSPPT